MKQKSITFSMLMLTFLIMGSLSAQVNYKNNKNREARLNTSTNQKTVIHQTTKSVDDYCTPSGICGEGDQFSDFIFAGIENIGSGCSPNGYGDFTSIQGTAEIGNTYTAEFLCGYDQQKVSMWIDFNDDEVFSDVERILTDHAASTTLTQVDIIMPGYAIPGIHRLRIGTCYDVPSSPDPCASFTYGEWEDYTIEITGSSVSYDAKVLSIDMAPVLLQGNIVPKATVKNSGSEIIDFPVTCTIEGFSSTKTITNMEVGEEIQIEFDNWSASSGNYIMEVETSLNGDEVPANNVLTADIAIVDIIPEKKVVGEEGTGTWCGNCVRGAVYLDSMDMKYPDTWIGIAVHDDDPMTVEEYDIALAPLIGYGYPGALVNRITYCDPTYFEANYENEIEIIAPATITIENRSFNAATGELSFTLTSDFIASVSDYRFNAVLVENEVTGTGPGWDQSNYYSGGGMGPMGGYEDLPNPVPAEDMVYQHTARAILGGFDGVESSLPAVVNYGETHSYEFTTLVSEEWDVDQLHIVGMLINQSSGKIENATISDLLVGLEEIERNSTIKVFPNPATERISVKSPELIREVTIYNHLGQLVYRTNASTTRLELTISHLKSGIYLLRILDETGYTTKKVVIN